MKATPRIPVCCLLLPVATWLTQTHFPQGKKVLLLLSEKKRVVWKLQMILVSQEKERQLQGAETGFRRASERSRVGAQIHGLLDTSSWDRNGIGSVLEEAMTRFAVMQRQTEERFRIWMEKLAHLDSDNDSSKRSSDAPEGQQVAQLSPPSSFLPSSESAETMAAYMLARESNSLTPTPMNNNSILPEAVAQNGNLGVPDPGLLNV
ncbi:hypothetical protein GOODEAATRI_010525 [Goodea atripinnis]|uniref:Uncharacterized protein n=1 Tax=Goodea atripinnis TaxID=208336 RepID=A0ABV0PME6_9TELE